MHLSNTRDRGRDLDPEHFAIAFVDDVERAEQSAAIERNGDQVERPDFEDNRASVSPLPVRGENVIFRRHYRMAPVPALGVIP